MKIFFLHGWHSTPGGVKPRLSVPKTEAVAHKARAPYQFRVGTLLIITAMYAALFGILWALSASPLVFALVATFFTVVGLGQKLLYNGQRPRKASMMAGICFFECLFIINCVVFGIKAIYSQPVFSFDPVEGAIFGAIYGYLAGVLIAGGFLLIDKLRDVGGKSSGRGQTT